MGEGTPGAATGNPPRPSPIYTQRKIERENPTMARRKSLKTVTENGTTMEQLESMARILAAQIESVEKDQPEEAAKLLPNLTKQYVDVITKIEERKKMEETDDEIAEILTARRADGKSDAIR